MLGIFISLLLSTTATALWPKPRLVTNGNVRVVLNPHSYGFKAVTQAIQLDEAFNRYKSIFFPHATDPVPDPSDTELVVDVLDVTTTLAMDVDESYVLDVHLDGSTIIAAKTVWGALHGLETMSQLVDFNFTTGQYSVSGLPVHIEDRPRFTHRGLLIDSGRHFEPVVHVKALLDSMSFAKLNVLHWHLTEDQSFPIASRVSPELATKGAYSNFEQYTLADIKDVVQKSHPELFAEGCLTESSRGAFDPAKNQTFDFLEAVLKDWSSVFPDMKTMGFSNSSDVFDYFVNRIANISSKLHRQTTFWDEAFLSAKPPKDAVIQNWHDASLMKQIVDAGYRAIYSNGWYLDGLSSTWDHMYVLDPTTNISADKAHLVLGGEGCMWGETVDPSDLEFTIWPRLAAIAERLWSDASVTKSTAEAEPRLEVFRCQLLTRGVPSGVVGGPGRGSPPGPGSCTQHGKTQDVEEMFV